MRLTVNSGRLPQAGRLNICERWADFSGLNWTTLHMQSDKGRANGLSASFDDSLRFAAPMTLKENHLRCWLTNPGIRKSRGCLVRRRPDRMPKTLKFSLGN